MSERDGWKEHPTMFEVAATAGETTLIAGCGVGYGSAGVHDAVPPELRPLIGVLLAAVPTGDVSEVHAFAVPLLVTAGLHGQLDAMLASLPRELREKWDGERSKVKPMAERSLAAARLRMKLDGRS